MNQFMQGGLFAQGQDVPVGGNSPYGANQSPSTGLFGTQVAPDTARQELLSMYDALTAKQAQVADTTARVQQTVAPMTYAQQQMAAAEEARITTLREGARTSGELGGDILNSMQDALLGTLEAGAGLVALTGNETAMELAQAASELAASNREDESDKRKYQREVFETGYKALTDSLEYEGMSGMERVQAQASYTAKALWDNPALIEAIGITGLTDILTGAGIGKLAAKGAVKFAGKEAADTVKDKAALAGVVGYEAVTSAGEGAASAMGAIQDMKHEELVDSEQYSKVYEAAEGTHEEKVQAAKNELALVAGRTAAPLTALATMGIGKLTGADKAIADAVTGKVTTSIAKDAVQSTAKEGIEETVQSAAEQAIANAAVNVAGVEKDIAEDVGRAAVEGAVGGTLAGGGLQAGAAPVKWALTREPKETKPEEVATYEEGINQVAAERAPVSPVAAPQGETKDTATEAAVAAQPIVDAGVEVTNIADAEEEHSARGTALMEEANAMMEGTAAFQETVAALDADEVDVSSLISSALSMEKAVQNFRASSQAAIDSGELTETELGHVTAAINRIDSRDPNSIYGAIGRIAENNPNLNVAVSMVREAMAGKPEKMDELREVLDSAQMEGLEPILVEDMQDILLKATLFSTDVLADTNITAESLTKLASTATNPETKAMLEETAKVKKLAEVAQEVTKGTDPWFRGVDTHIGDVVEALSTGGDVTAPLNRLDNFANTQRNALAAMQQAVELARQPNAQFPVSVPYNQINGKGGSVWTINHPGAIDNTVTKMIPMLSERIGFIEQGMQAAVALTQGIAPGSKLTQPTPKKQKYVPEYAREVEEVIAQQEPREAVETTEQDAAIARLQGMRNASQKYLDALMANTPEATRQIEEQQERIADLDTEIAEATAQRDALNAPTSDEELDGMQWQTAVDASAIDTKLEQGQNMVNDALSVLTGKRAIDEITKQWGVDMSTPTGIRKFAQSLNMAGIAPVIGLIKNLRLTQADTKALAEVLGTSAMITNATPALEATLSALNSEPSPRYTDEFNKTNRFRDGVVAFTPSRLWEDTDYLSEFSNMVSMTIPEMQAKLAEWGFDTEDMNDSDYEAIKQMGEVRQWFHGVLGSRMVALKAVLDDPKTQAGVYNSSVLRYLVDADGNMPEKIMDAAFLAYIGATNDIGESASTSTKDIQRFLGLSDESQLDYVENLDGLLAMGTPVTSRTLGDAFKRTLGLNHSRDLPASVKDGIYTAMGNTLFTILKQDPGLLASDPVLAEGMSVTGFVLNTPKGNKNFLRVNPNKKVAAPMENNFHATKNAGRGVFAQVADSGIDIPSNYVNTDVPGATNRDSYIRSNEKLPDNAVEAENIYRETEWEADATVASALSFLGEDGFKTLMGYDDSTENMNAEHRKSVEGKNQQIISTYAKAMKLVGDGWTGKTVRFSSKFSSVRRQQMEGAVNPQGNKFDRILLGLKGGATINFDMNTMKAAVGSPEYNFMLALGQAYGKKVDKQNNQKSYDQMAETLHEIHEEYMDGTGVYAALGQFMNADGEFVSKIPADVVKALREEAGSEHKLQGVLTVARMLHQSQDGVVSNFKHYLRAEIDGLTNGPAHSTVMSGLHGMDKAGVVAAMARGGYLVGDATGNNTHVQIGDKQITDSYLTVASFANGYMAENVEYWNKLMADPATPAGVKKDVQRRKNALNFLTGKQKTPLGKSIAAELTDNGEFIINRGGTKNPVTVTVYGGGASGINNKLASVVRELFAQELTEAANRVQAGTMGQKALHKFLADWSEFMVAQPVYAEKLVMLPLADAVKGKNRDQVVQLLRDFTFTPEMIRESTGVVASAYGNAINRAIDTVFENNKRSAAIMNLAVNYMTALVNQTFEDAYIALHKKRVEEGTIDQYDTLSDADVGLLQRKLAEMYPSVKTAVGDTSNVATRSDKRIAEVGRSQVRYISEAGKATPVDIRHSHTAMGLPGVRAIPVLTISIDGSVQINNHLLQGTKHNYLNVLDAIDVTADQNLRVANEVFNAAEYMGLMDNNTLANVRSAFDAAIKAQNTPLEIEGIQLTPTLSKVTAQDGDATTDVVQETYFRALRDMTLPVMPGIPASAFQIGNTEVLLGYISKQLEIEDLGNQAARNDFFFGSEDMSVNQMAGIDDGHARIYKGTIKLTDEAREYLGDKVALIDSFNEKMKARYNEYKAEGNPEIPEDTELESYRKAYLEAGAEEKAAIGHGMLKLLNYQDGIWQAMRATFDRVDGTLTFKLPSGVSEAAKATRRAFAQALTPAIDGDNRDGTNMFAYGVIPTVGNLIGETLKGQKTKSLGMLDNILQGLEVRLEDTVKDDNGNPTSADGSFRMVDGKPVITIKLGLETGKANTVLAHEIIHAVTAKSIHDGLFGEPGTSQHLFTQELYKQMQRALAVSEPDQMPVVRAALDAYTDSQDKANLYVALAEYVATVATEREYADFLESRVSKDKLSDKFLEALDNTWNAIKKYLAEAFGYTFKGEHKLRKRHQTFVAKVEAANMDSVSEYDVLARIISGLGETAYAVSPSPDMQRALFSQDTSAMREGYDEAMNVVKAAEGQLNDFMRTGANATVKAILRSIPNETAGKVAQLIENEGISATIDSATNALVMGHQFGGNDGAGKRLGVFQSTIAEFLNRDREHSRTIDEHADKSKSALDRTREGTKQAVVTNLTEKLGDISEAAHQALLTVAIKGEGMKLGADNLKAYLSNPAALNTAIQNKMAEIKALPLDKARRAFMINEAMSLGLRGITGKTYAGFNLPNAKAIVNMAGVNLQAVTDTDGSIEAKVDELATLYGLTALGDIDKARMIDLLARNLAGVEQAVATHDATKKAIVEQYGEGILMSLPKGFINDQVNPNRAVKVVPWQDRNKYKGYRYVREFIRDSADPTGTKMALLASDEGGAVPFVQGAMSTIEGIIGGFSTTYGSAADKSLPSLTGLSARKATQERGKQLKQYVSGIRTPVEKRDGMVPLVNAQGKIVSYRYVLGNAERMNLLDVSTDSIDTLAAYRARIGEQRVSQDFNRKLISTLKAAYDNYTVMDGNRDNDFVKISPISKDPEIAQLWRLMPEYLRKEAEKQNGEKAVYVHRRDLDNAFGYREYSVTQMWNEKLHPNSKRRIAVEAMESIMGDDAMVRLRWAERVLQEAVVTAKDFIVVKSVVVPAVNILSNVLHLAMRGVDLLSIPALAKEGTEGLRQYKEDEATIRKLLHLNETTPGDYTAEILKVEERLRNNPIRFMIDAGLLSSVMADVEAGAAHGSVKEGIINRYVPDFLKEKDNEFLDVGRNLLIMQGSSTYQFLADAVEAGDFVAKYILIKHLMEEEGKTAEEAITTARTEFVNYNTLTNKELDYINKVGGIFFFKYFARIQPIIARAIEENPTRALTTYIGVDTTTLPSVFDAMVLDKDITATTGAYDLLTMAGGAHPLF